jgi:hypothetical protein
MGRPPGPERRHKLRLKLPQVVRVRPSEPHVYEFDEILSTLNAARDSAYFVSQNDLYEEGMRLFVTFPYSKAPGSINRDFVAKVVRIEDLGKGRRGIAVQILMPLSSTRGDSVR